MAESGGLEHRYASRGASRVRIPPSPPLPAVSLVTRVLGYRGQASWRGRHMEVQTARWRHMKCPRRCANVAGMRELSPTEWAVLGLLSREPQHGFALAKHLSCGGDFGHVWTVQRPLVYRALDTLQADCLVESLSAEPGDGGPPRRKMMITERGRGQLREWLRTPVRHIRDARSKLLLKLAIIDDLGVDPTPLIESQSEVLKAIEQGLELHLAQASASSERVALLYRLESARAFQRFLAQLVPA